MSNKNQRQLSKTLLNFYNQPVARVSVELFLTIGTVLFFAVFAIRPTLLTMSDLIKELEEKRELDTKLSEKIASLSTAQTQFIQLEPRLVSLDEAIPLQPQFYEAITMIEKSASDNQLVIDSLSLQTIPPESPADQPLTLQKKQFLSFQVSLEGGYEEIKAFINQLQTWRRLFTVENIVFSVEEERETRKLQANLTIYAYYYGLDLK